MSFDFKINMLGWTLFIGVVLVAVASVTQANNEFDTLSGLRGRIEYWEEIVLEWMVDEEDPQVLNEYEQMLQLLNVLVIRIDNIEMFRELEDG